jgi:hypothetical protein
MTLTLDITPELESQLRREAAQKGLDPAGYVLKALGELLENARAGSAARLGAEEARLLLKINEGLPETTWRRYRELVARRQAETLTSGEHEELIARSDHIEEVHARRLGYVAELARLRGVSLESLIEELGIRAPSNG